MAIPGVIDMGDASEVLLVSPAASSAAVGQSVSESQRPTLGGDSENPDVLFVLGMLALKDGRHQAAIDLLVRGDHRKPTEVGLPLLSRRGVPWRWRRGASARLLSGRAAIAFRLCRSA